VAGPHCKKGGRFRKSVEIAHKKLRTTWEWTLVVDHVPDKPTIELQQVKLRSFNFDNLLDIPASDVMRKAEHVDQAIAPSRALVD
jgi:hypothetical protein